jgi:hypothetical protein
MTWGVSLLQEGWHVGYPQAVDRTAAVAMGWVFGCPILGYIADRIGRRKPVVLAGAALMLAATLAIFYLPPETFPPYLLGFLLGFGSGAAMIPYSSFMRAGRLPQRKSCNCTEKPDQEIKSMQIPQVRLIDSRDNHLSRRQTFLRRD